MKKEAICVHIWSISAGNLQIWHVILGRTMRRWLLIISFLIGMYAAFMKFRMLIIILWFVVRDVSYTGHEWTYIIMVVILT